MAQKEPPRAGPSKKRPSKPVRQGRGSKGKAVRGAKRAEGLRVIVAGSRNVTEFYIVARALNCCKLNIGEVVSGCARGVDSLGEQWARLSGIKVKQFPADWNAHGRGAGFIRNIEMARYADALVAIWDGKSPGTKHMIETAVKLGLIVKVCAA